MKNNNYKYLSVCFVLLILGSCGLFGTSDEEEGTKGEITEHGRDKSGTAVEKDIYNSNLWGEWVRMDTGAVWYFTGNYLSINNSANDGSAFTVVRQSENVVQVTEKLSSGNRIFYLYASRIPNGNFKGTIYSSSQNVDGLSLRFTDTTNMSITKTVTTDSNGNFKVSDIVIGNEYNLSVGNRTIPVTANTNGEDIGTITLGDGVSFKIKISPAASNIDMLRLYPNTNYSFNIAVTNIGSERTATPRYIMTLPAGITRVSGADLSGNLATLDPGKTDSSTLNITLSCDKDSITDEFENKQIRIKMVDAFDDSKTWNDSVDLKFNKEKETFYFRSYHRIPGVVIVPGAKAYFFNTTAGSTGNFNTTMEFPKYTGKPYLIVFSGASVLPNSATLESIYSFAIGQDALTPTNENFLAVSGGSITGYDKFNVETNPMILTPYNKQHVSRLWSDGIIYYSVTFPSDED